MHSHLTIKKIVNGLIYFVVCMLIYSTTMADVIFSAPPREDAERGNEIYLPIVEKLSEILGEKVVYEQPGTWLEYSRKMRQGYYDIVFDGPHFTAWRMKHLDHTPIVTLPGRLSFLLVVNKNDVEIKAPRDLVGKQICGMASPHLATDMIYDLYKNPVLQPQIYDVRGQMKDVYLAFKAGKCRATIFRDAAFQHLPKKEKEQLKIIAKTRTLPNQTISVSDRLKANANKLATFFTSKDGAIVSEGILSRYSKKEKYFQGATVAEYSGAETILEESIFGW